MIFLYQFFIIEPLYLYNESNETNGVLRKCTVRTCSCWYISTATCVTIFVHCIQYVNKDTMFAVTCITFTERLRVALRRHWLEASSDVTEAIGTYYYACRCIEHSRFSRSITFLKLFLTQNVEQLNKHVRTKSGRLVQKNVSRNASCSKTWPELCVWFAHCSSTYCPVTLAVATFAAATLSLTHCPLALRFGPFDVHLVSDCRYRYSLALYMIQIS